jgi:hypothetical protein
MLDAAMHQLNYRTGSGGVSFGRGQLPLSRRFFCAPGDFIG